MANQRDLIAELRSWAVYSESPMPHAAQSVCVAAADEITRLRTALASARQRAMEEAIACIPGGQICDPQEVADAIRRVADMGENATPPDTGG